MDMDSEMTDGEMERAFGVFTSKTPADDVRYLYDLNEQRKEAVCIFVKKLVHVPCLSDVEIVSLHNVVGHFSD